MVGKAKAIAHGARAIEYAMRESKKGYLVMSHLVQSETPDAIYKEFLEAQKYNTRCKNKFIRIEIGIAPADEKKLEHEDLVKICSEFSKRFGFKNHQWIACTHRDTDNFHMHMIVNRIGIDHSVFDTAFISKRAGKIAEEISRDMGLTIANEVKRQSKYRPEVTSFERMLVRAKIEKAANDVLSKKPKSLREFSELMKKQGIEVKEAVNKKGNTYGLRFSTDGQTFKASQIGKEFGYRTLMNTFSEDNRQNNLSQRQSHNQEQKHSQDKGASIIGEIVSGLGSMITPINHSLDDLGLTVAEEEERRRKRKKKRMYGRQQ